MTEDEYNNALALVVEAARTGADGAPMESLAGELDVRIPTLQRLLDNPGKLNDEQRWFLARWVFGAAERAGDLALALACDAVMASIEGDLDDDAELPEIPAVPESSALLALRASSPDEWVTRLMGTFRLDVDPRVWVAARKRARRTRRDLTDVKREALEIGLRLALAQTTEPWVPRVDSRSVPIIPADVYSTEELRNWVDRQARTAAKCELRGIEYPRPKDRYDTLYDRAADLEDDAPEGTDVIEKVYADLRAELGDDDGETDATRPEVSALVDELLEVAKGSDLEVLEAWLSFRNPTPEAVAAYLGKSAGSVRQAIWRLRELARDRRRTT
jgi:hypothetical protein